MDRMKKIKRQLSMTLRGGRGTDKTNGVPEQIGLDESGGGGGSDLGEAPTRVAPGELRSVRGPLSSAPGGSTLIIHSPCPSSQILPLRLLSSFSLASCFHFLSFPLIHFQHTPSILLDCFQAPGWGRVPWLFSCPKAFCLFFCILLVALSVSLDLSS